MNFRKYIVVIASAFVLLLVGVVAGKKQVFPYPIFYPFVEAINAVEATVNLDEYNHEIRWKHDSWHKEGVTTHAPERMYGDMTLFTTAHDQTVRLIDTKGTVRYEWPLSFNAIWPDQAHLYAPKHMDDSYFYLRDVHLYPDGSLVTIFGAGGLTPWGAGMVKVDKDARVLWKIPDFFYNRFTVAADGTIYALRHQIRMVGFYQVPDVIKAPMLEDTITIISPDGTVQDSIPVLQAFMDSDYAAFAKFLGGSPEGDYTHTNSVDVLARDVPGVSWLKKGYLLLSLRNPHAFAVIDPGTKTVVHASWLQARRQHDISLTARNTLVMYDNQGYLGKGGFSRVMEIDPVSLGATKSFDGEGLKLASVEWGAVEDLPNGNYLITDSESGRLVEIDSDGNIVWEYFFSGRKDGDIAVVTASYRFKSGDLPFLVGE
jgi:hypothetical protein